MSVRSSQSVTVVFSTSRFDTGAATNADSTPTGTLYLNGTANGATVTVTNIDTGRYKAAVTLPTLAAGDIVDLSIAATVNSVAGKATVWRDTCDLTLDANGRVDLGYVNETPITGAGGTVDASLVASGLDRVLVESGISASAALTDDAGTQLTAVNARQVLALLLSDALGIIAGATGGASTVTVKPGGLPAGNTRLTIAADANGNRSTASAKVPT